MTIGRFVALCAVLVLAGLPLWLRRRYLVVTVDGESMSPTYRPGDRVVVRRTRPSAIRRGQVVVFAATLEQFWQIAAVQAALVSSPGLGPDTGTNMGPGVDPPAWPVHDVGVDLPVEAGQWMIKRAVAIAGDPVPRAGVPALRDVSEPTVPVGHLVLTGDNAAKSYDSRHFGYVSAERLLGVVVRRMT